MRRTNLLVIAAIVLTPASALGFRQTRTCLNDIAPAPTGTPRCGPGETPQLLAWRDLEVPYRVNEQGSAEFPGGLEGELLDTIIASFDQWNAPDCSPFTFVYDGTTATDEYVRDDGMNVVVFQDDVWPYSSAVLAVTTVTADVDGFIVNADMELNGVEHTFAIVDGNTGVETWDVQNTITHEAGHVLGLDHDAVPDSTMEFEAEAGDINKRDLHPDDIEGLCAIYPPVTEPTDPGGSDDGCCRVAAGGRAYALLLLWIIGGAVLVRRRKLNA